MLYAFFALKLGHRSRISNGECVVGEQVYVHIIFRHTPEMDLGGDAEVQRREWVRIEFDGERFRKKEGEMGAG